MFKKCLKLVVVLLVIATTIACKKGEDANNQKVQILKLGVMTKPYQNVLNKYVKPALQKEGIELVIVEFSDYNTPNLALYDKSIDVNAFQHQQFLDKFNATNNTDIIPAGITTLSPIGFYSKKLKNVDDIKEYGKIAIPNDPSNEGRVLLILQNQVKLIKIKDGVDVNSITPNDIIENPKNIQFTELDAASLPRVVDEFDVAVINDNYAINAGFDPTKDPILREDATTSPYINIFAIRPESKDDIRIEKLIRAFQTREVAEGILEETKGAIIPGWKY
ncbi:MAG: MetQ/NlpA family ABC transporter substrate-binding protein [Rickettsiales bacterium]|nr:MetQ/NlpA family ABC transporter substrate-binding protein [Rickettsiales bacterium]